MNEIGPRAVSSEVHFTNVLEIQKRYSDFFTIVSVSLFESIEVTNKMRLKVKIYYVAN